MFCTKCGALIYEGEKFCSKCGSPVKNAAGSGYGGSTANAEYDPYVISITPERAAELMRGQNTGTKAGTGSDGKKKKFALVLAVLAAVILVLIFVGLLSNVLGATTPQEIIDALADNESGADDAGAYISESDSEDIFILGGTTEEIQSLTTTTVQTTTTTTTTTTAAATTTTQQDPLIFQAKEIRDLLISKKWKTTIDGYDALITFYDDNTALIEVNVKLGFFNVNQKINATYEITPKCFAKIVGEYNGTKYGVSGIISKVNSSELIVDRGGDRGTVTLVEAK